MVKIKLVAALKGLEPPNPRRAPRSKRGMSNHSITEQYAVLTGVEPMLLGSEPSVLPLYYRTICCPVKIRT